MPPETPPQEPFGRIPTPTLQQGGGAIQGLGEKFVASPSGTARLTVPLVLPPGRDGFSPALSLSYDSCACNGVFGIGWSLSLPSIVRKTEKGLPRYRDHEESDTYLLSDIDDLVPALVRNGAGWTIRDRHPQRARPHVPRVPRRPPVQTRGRRPCVPPEAGQLQEGPGEDDPPGSPDQWERPFWSRLWDALFDEGGGFHRAEEFGDILQTHLDFPEA